MPFFKKKQENKASEPDKIEEAKKRIYLLESIAIASRLTEKGSNNILNIIPKIEEDMEKNDPFNLPDNVSQERYERVSEKYDFLSFRLERDKEALDIYEKLKHIENRNQLLEFETPVSIEFDYVKSSGESSKRKGIIKRYDYIDFKLFLFVVEEGLEIEKQFHFNNMSNLKIDNRNFNHIQDYLIILLNSNIYRIFNELEIKKD